MEYVLLSDARLLAASTLGYTACFTVAHLCLRPVVRLTAIDARYRGDWINRVLASFHAIIAGAAGVFALASEEPFRTMTANALLFRGGDMVHGHSTILAQVLPFTLGYFLYDCGVMAIDSEVYMALMVVHHVVSIVVWPISFLSQAGTVYP